MTVGLTLVARATILLLRQSAGERAKEMERKVLALSRSELDDPSLRSKSISIPRMVRRAERRCRDATNYVKSLLALFLPGP